MQLYVCSALGKNEKKTHMEQAWPKNKITQTVGGLQEQIYFYTQFINV